MVGPAAQSMGTAKQKPGASMPKLERSPSHSWWWDSHNSPKHSKWLQSNLQDLDEKVKEMLRLIEEDADSFAQRAEMYYQKRPELVNLVEAFYRAYRSLAERYDHLTREIRQNIPRALQVQLGLSCDSPRVLAHANGGGGGERHSSPLRCSSQMLESLLKKAFSPVQDHHHHQAEESDQTGDSAQGKCARDACMKENEEQNSGQDDPSIDSSSSSDMAVDDSALLTRLKQEIDALKESNRALTDSHQKALQSNASLLTKIRELEEGGDGSKINEAPDVLQAADLQHIETTSDQDVQAGILLGNGAEAGKELQAEILPLHLEEEMDSCAGEKDTCHGNASETPKDSDMAESEQEGAHAEHRSTQKEQQGAGALVDGLRCQITQLEQEVLERGEEKRAAIRQLCLSMDILKSNNRSLEVKLALLKKKKKKKKLNGSSSAGAGLHHSPIAAWKQVVAMVGGWRGRAPLNKRGATVAL